MNFEKNSLSYEAVNKVLISQIEKGSINEKTILNSTNYIKKNERTANGIFYTPAHIVNELHAYLDMTLGKTWKKRYSVWDSACGKASLTKNINVKNLYLSTLEKTDIDFINKIGYNDNSNKFQFDFLNDSVENVPKNLLNALKNDKPFLFIINPPYAINKNTQVAKNMMEANHNHYVYRLTHIQFLYRIMQIKKEFNLTNIKIAIIAPLAFLTKQTFDIFRKEFFNSFDILKGFVFNSKEFNLKYGDWIVGTTIFKIGNRKNISRFKYDIYKTDEKKTLYTISQENSALKYIKRFTNIIKSKQYKKSLPMKSAISWGGDTITRYTSPIDSIGYYVSANNNVNSSNYSYLLSSQPSYAYGVPVVGLNFEDVLINFTTRKAVRKNWLNSYDEYIKPSEDVIKKRAYKQLVKDSTIYSLFNQSSHQSSLRNISFNGKNYDVHNDWFWMSPEDIDNLATHSNYEELLKDLDMHGRESFILNKIDFQNISDDATTVLEFANYIIATTFEYRKYYSEKHPERHLNSWDAGWQQMKPMIKSYNKKLYNNFIDKYNSFENRLKEKIYDFKFLK